MSSEPSDDERRIGAAKRLQSDHYCSRPTQPHDRLRPDLRSAADAAVRADRGRIGRFIAGHWQLRWNGPPA